VFGCAAIAITCVAVASPVYGFVAKRSHSVVVPKLQKGSATARCPAGEHVTSGGVIGQFRPPIGAGPIMFTEGMRRTAANKWTVYGWNNADFIGSRLTAIAYCDKGPVPTVAQKTVTLPGFRVASAIATCPAGTVVVGGGYNSGASAQHVEILARLNRLASTQWVVTMVNLRSAATKLTSIAYCGHGVAPTQVASMVTLAAQKGGTARVSCPAGTSIVFGGVVANSPVVGKKSAVVAPFSWSAASTKQWVVTGFNAGDTAGGLIAVAYCR
jgi:hypothetical protein